MEKNRAPLISIITPTLNSGRFIKKNLESIQNQSFRNFEHIIIDGGSTDNTLDIIRGFEKGAIISSEKDRGISHAFNRGLRLAKGKVIGILNADDFYDDDVLKDVAEIYRDTDFDFIVHGTILMHDGGRSYCLKPRSFPNLFFYFDIPYYHPTVFVPRRIYDRVGLFDEKFSVAMDYDFLLRASLNGCRFRTLERVIANFRLGGTANLNPVSCHKEVFRSQVSHGLNPAVCRLALLLKLAFHHLKRICPFLEELGRR